MGAGPGSAMAIPCLATPRLLLRPLALTDAPAIQALFPRWEIVRHLASRVPKASGNAASRRLSLRAGMRLAAAGEGDFVEGRLPEELWELTAEEWRAHQTLVTP